MKEIRTKLPRAGRRRFTALTQAYYERQLWCKLCTLFTTGVRILGTSP
jgi:hypothetical protein